MRIGQGYDVHRLVEGRDLILGGVTVPYEKGMNGIMLGACMKFVIFHIIRTLQTLNYGNPHS